MAPQVVVITGPTASGKTALSVALAKAFGGEIVNADSMQIYRTMDIGTAKPTLAERQGVVHHLLDVAEPQENFSVARYVELATPCVEDILRRGRLPIVVGGTGLYIDSLLSGRTFAPYPQTGWRQRLTEQAQVQGMEPLLRELERVDPEAAARLHPNDRKRIIRALEVWHETGRTISQHNRETAQLPPRFTALKLALSFHSRQDLWRRIDRRVDLMAAQGLVEEVRRLLERGVDPACTAMQAIGYKELVSALEGERTVADALEEIKLRSRQYAKRQLTWLRRDEALEWFLWDSEPEFSKAVQFATEKLHAVGVG